MEKSNLRRVQEMHTIRFGLLLEYATEMGMKISLGDAFRDPRVHGEFGEKIGYGSANSLHKLKLACDLNTTDENHEKLHKKWTELGGNKPILNDMNHYSSPWGVFK